MNTITPEQAIDIITKNEARVLDVRSASEYKTGHINGAQNIDFYGEGFEDELEKLDKNACYVVNCLSGGRSGKTVAMMEHLGFKDVKNLVGGITAWNNKGFPVVTN